MSQKTRYQLEVLRDSLIRSGGENGKTTAENIRDFQSAISESLSNILDDANANEGFVQIDSSGRIDPTFLNVATPLGAFLRDDGTFVMIAPRVDAHNNDANYTLNSDLYDVCYLKNMTSNTTINNPSFTDPISDSRRFTFKFKDSGISRTLTWGAAFEPTVSFALPSATTAGKLMVLDFIYNNNLDKFLLINSQIQA